MSCWDPEAQAWRQVAKGLPDADNAYMEWVTTYSSPAYHEVPAKLEQLIEEIGPKVPYGAACAFCSCPGWTSILYGQSNQSQSTLCMGCVFASP